MQPRHFRVRLFPTASNGDTYKPKYMACPCDVAFIITDQRLPDGKTPMLEKE